MKARWMLASLALAMCATHASSQEPDLSPGGEPHRVHALVGGTVIPRAGERVEGGTVVIRDGLIAAIGSGIAIPADARVWDMRGLTITPGLIESYLRLEPESVKKGAKPAPGAHHEIPAVRSHHAVVEHLRLDPKRVAELRDLGFTSALVVPSTGVLRGQSVLVNLRDGEPRDQVIRARVAQHVGLVPSGEDYPNSQMGAMALIRQTLLDAGHLERSRAAYARRPQGQERPPANLSLEALAPALSGRVPVCVEATDAQMLLRSAHMLREFNLRPWIVLGGCDAYRWLDEVRSTGCPLILSLNFPPPPRFDGSAEAVNVETDSLRHWRLSRRESALMSQAGTPFAFTTQGLSKRSDFRARVREALAEGLTETAALAAFTETPARLFKAPLGALALGSIANLTITDGEPFAETTRVVEVWVDGIRYPPTPSLPAPADLAGTWQLELEGALTPVALKVTHERGHLRGEWEGTDISIRLVRDRLRVVLPSTVVGGRSAVLATFRMQGRRLTGRWEATGGGGLSGGVHGRIESAPPTVEGDAPPPPPPALPAVQRQAAWPPLPEPAPPAVLVRGATVWTLGPQGTLKNADLLCKGGKVSQIGFDLPTPPGAVVIDGRGLHVTPGIIDCHSHSFVSGRVNESSNNCTAEVRIADVINAQTPHIYRQLAGGVTTANVLHGSANAIGGQSAVIQLRWGQPPRGLLLKGATPGMKWALGENPKRSNWGQGLKPRYPTTRMGVQESIRERLQAARDYKLRLGELKLDSSPDRIPPRIDLQLEALVEILEGKRLVHCHSYRQDEILSLIRLAEEFGFTIGTFQHVLEGYKVADEIAAHGAGASTFSDWWAYKFEVYDAIAYNGTLMQRRGVVVSFNSDSSEMARRLNHEAAKAVRYGGLAEDEALKFVTLNPAKQLKIDRLVGSLEAGKQADFVVWSAHPLQIASVAQETWIGGRRYYDRAGDRQALALFAVERLALLQAAQRARYAKGAQDADTWRPTFHKKPAPDGEHSCRGGAK